MTDTIDRLLDELEGNPEERPEIMGKVVPLYRHTWSRHPDQIRVSFEDGSTAIYDLRTTQPHPVVLESIRIIRKWKGYDPKHGRTGS